MPERYTEDVLAIETRIGEAIAAGGLRLVPVARSWRLKLGGGSLVWTRPTAVRVEPAPGVAPKGKQTTVPIRDWTRCWQLMLLGAGLAGSACLWLGASRRRNRWRR